MSLLKKARKERRQGWRGEGGREEREKERKQRNEEGKTIQENSLLFSVPSLQKCVGYESPGIRGPGWSLNFTTDQLWTMHKSVHPSS